MADDTMPPVASFKGSFQAAMARQAKLRRAREGAAIAKYRAIKAEADARTARASRIIKSSHAAPQPAASTGPGITRNPLPGAIPGPGNLKLPAIAKRKPGTAVPLLPKRVPRLATALAERRIVLEPPVAIERIHRNALGGTRPRKGLLT